ncbi:hypothetical protein NDU88_002972 [Pleurodeles waltl]|uniref:Uncharacterized protein n=1 Tax=Pleurodeles waltl TaxID=8319 RepID=A0AAV7MPV8_PLEWA|nr:hypothetical protein NDU88_002972 [Pleurodeles waltl]
MDFTEASELSSPLGSSQGWELAAVFFFFHPSKRNTHRGPPQQPQGSSTSGTPEHQPALTGPIGLRCPARCPPPVHSPWAATISAFTVLRRALLYILNLSAREARPGIRATLPSVQNVSSYGLERPHARARPPACLRSGHFLARFKPPGRKRATRTHSGSSTAVSPKPSAHSRAATRLRRRVALRRCSARGHTPLKAAAGLQVRPPAPCFTQLPARPYTPAAGAGSTSARLLCVPFHTRGRGREQARLRLLTAAAPVNTPFPSRRKRPRCAS